MNQAELLREYGLIDAISTITMMKSEEVAMFGYIYDSEHCAEICYMELQMSVDSLVTQLTCRYGIREGDRIIVNCLGNAVAEVVSCLACCRLRATFVPIDSEWIRIGSRLSDIISDCNAVAAIVVAKSDADGVVKALAAAGLHRCIQLQPDGNIIYDDSWQALCSSTTVSSSSVSPDVSLNMDSSTINPTANMLPAPPVYILYTSGSTGRPKGVRGTTKGLINRLIWQGQRFPWTQSNSFAKSDDSASSCGDSSSEVGSNMLVKDCFDTPSELRRPSTREGDGNSLSLIPKGDSGSYSSMSETDNNDSGMWDYSIPENHSGDDILCKRTPLIFVDAIAEIFGALTAGKPLFVPPRNDAGKIDMTRLAVCVCKHGVSHVTMLPSQLHLIMTLIQQENEQNASTGLSRVGTAAIGMETMKSKHGRGSLKWTSLRIVFVSGEPCPMSTVKLFHQLVIDGIIPSAAQLVNLYGSTEVAGDVGVSVLCDGLKCLLDISDAKKYSTGELPQTSVGPSFVPIASEFISGNTCYIAMLSRQSPDEAPFAACGNEMSWPSGSTGDYVSVEEGAVGELLVGGCHVADGYLMPHTESSTSLKFIKKPIGVTIGYGGNPLQRIMYTDTQSNAGDDILYCTGDLVRLVKTFEPINVSSDSTSPSCLHIELLGRNDLQVKARGGVRISLSDMENVLAETFRTGLLVDDSEGSGASRDMRLEGSPMVICSTCDAGTSQKYASGETVLVAFVDCSLLYTSLGGLPSAQVKVAQIGSATANASIVRTLSTAGRHYLMSRGVPMAYLPDVIVGMAVGSIYRTTVTGKIDRQKYKAEASALVDLLCADSEDVMRISSTSLNPSVSKEIRTSPTANSALVSPHQIIHVLALSLPGLTICSETCCVQDNSLLEWSFAALGGDSMSAQVALWQIEKIFGVKVAVIDLMEQSIERVVMLVMNAYHDNLADLAATHTSTGNVQMGHKKRKSNLECDNSQNIDEFAESTWKCPRLETNARNAQCHYDKQLTVVNVRDNDISRIDWSCRTSGFNDEMQCFIKGRGVHLEVPHGVHIPTWTSTDKIATRGALPSSAPEESSTKHCNRSWRQQATGLTENTAETMQLTQIWKQSLNRCVDSSPLAVCSMSMDKTVIYTASHGGRVCAFSAAGGEEVWRTELGDDVHVEGGCAVATDFSLSVHNIATTSVSTVPSTDSVSGHNRDGSAWRGPIYVNSYFARDVDGGSTNTRLFADSEQQLPPSSPASSSVGRLWCLDSQTGTVLWHSSDHIEGEVKNMPVLGRLPVLGNTSGSEDGQVSGVEAVLVGSHDGSLYAFCACTGMLLGSRRCAIGSLFAAPVVMGIHPIDRCGDACGRDTCACGDAGGHQVDVCVSSTSGRIQSIGIYLIQHSNLKANGAANFKPESGMETYPRAVFCLNWEILSCDEAPLFGTPCYTRFDTGKMLTKLHSDHGTKKKGSHLNPIHAADTAILVYATVGGSVCAVEPISGHTIWKHNVVPVRLDRCAIFSSPVATAESKTMWMVFGGHDGCVRALDMCTGQLVWTVSVAAAVYATPQIITITQACLEDDKISTPGDVDENLENDKSTVVVVCTTSGDVCVIGSLGGDSERASLPIEDGVPKGTGFNWQVLARCRLDGEIFSSPVFVPCNNAAIENGYIREKSDQGNDDNVEEDAFIDAPNKERPHVDGHVYVGCRDDCLHCIGLRL